MTDMLTRPLTTENRLLRAAGGPDLTVSLGTAAGAVFSTPAMGGLAMQAGRARQAQEGAFTAEQTARLDMAEIERAQRVEDLRRSMVGAVDMNERQAIYGQIEEIERVRETVLDAEMRLSLEEGRVQPPEVLAEQYGELGLTFDRPMTKEEADILADGKRAEIIRNALIEAGPRGVLPGAAKFASGMAGMMTDPLELATMFIPIVGQAGKAAAIARFGTIGGRVAVGAVEGAVGQAITEPFYYGLSRQAQLDYDMSDALLSVGVGVIFGGGVGAVAGAFARRAELQATTAATDAIDLPRPRQDVVDDVTKEVADLAFRQFVTGARVDIGRLIDGRDLRSTTTLSRINGIEFQSQQTLPPKVAEQVRPSYIVHNLKGEPMYFERRARAEAYAKERGGEVVAQDGKFSVKLKVDGDVMRRPDGKPLTFGTERAAQKFIQSAREIDPNASVIPLGPRTFAVSKGMTPETVANVLNARRSLEIPDGINTRAIAVLPDADARISAAVRGVVAQRMIMADMPDPSRVEADPLADMPASRAADVRLSDTFMDDHIAELEAMAAQIEGADVELAAIRDIEQRAQVYAETAEAAAVCLARTP
jgi:hypothetical protein